MGVWKLRVLVYGMLLVIAALVAAARLAPHETKAPPPVQRVPWLLDGHTSQGMGAFVNARFGNLQSFRLYGMRLTCPNGEHRTWTWRGTPGGVPPNRAGRIHVHERYRRWELTVDAFLVEGGRSIHGVARLSERHDGGLCSSGPVFFDAAST